MFNSTNSSQRYCPASPFIPTVDVGTSDARAGIPAARPHNSPARGANESDPLGRFVCAVLELGAQGWRNVTCSSPLQFEPDVPQPTAVGEAAARREAQQADAAEVLADAYFNASTWRLMAPAQQYRGPAGIHQILDPAVWGFDRETGLAYSLRQAASWLDAQIRIPPHGATAEPAADAAPRESCIAQVERATSWYTSLVHLINDALGPVMADPLDAVSAFAPEFKGRDALLYTGYFARVEPRYTAVVQGEVERLTGPGSFHTFATESKWVYPRNLVQPAPGGAVLHGGGWGASLNEASRDIAAFLDRAGVPCRVLRFNLANVEQPRPDTLVVAGSRSHPVTPAAMAQLRSAYNNPPHVVHFELNVDWMSPAGHERCLDLDLAFLPMRNTRGEDVAFLVESCIVANPSNAPLGRDDVAPALKSLGFRIFRVSDEDQGQLATNSLAWPQKMGYVLFTRRKEAYSASFLATLARAAVVPLFPEHNHGFGVEAARPFWGFHCLLAHIRLPWPKAKSEPRLAEPLDPDEFIQEEL
jgi:hypothetical protein